MKKTDLIIQEMAGKLFKLFVVFTMSLIINTGRAGAQQTSRIFSDYFDGTMVSNQKWHIPTWVSPTDGTYLGRTQFRCTQSANMPAATSGQAIINVESYNPTGSSFYGTDLITNRSFKPGKGLIFTIRAKINSPVPGGIVGGIFLYDLTCSCGALHDEIDFELLTNDINKVHTNIYSNEPLGTGHPDSVSVVNPFTDYHSYEIKWLPTGVSWSVDGNLIRTSNISPAGPMHFHLNMWVPDNGWKAAFNGSLIPSDQPGLNQMFSMIVDRIEVDSLTDVPTSIAYEKKAEISFYPNPARDQINFSIPGKINVNIYNGFGNLVRSKKEITGTLDVSGLPQGLYLIKYEIDGVCHTKKLIIE